MNRFDFYYKQKVTEAELDGAFDAVELAIWAFAQDHQLRGILQGAEVVERPAPDLTVDLTAPGRIYTQEGKRVAWAVQLTKDCQWDENGLPTAVATPGNERWLTLFAASERLLSDQRVDGHGVPIWYSRAESYQINVAMGAEAVIGAATRPALRSTEVLLADIHLINGQVEILTADIDFTRREELIHSQHGSWELKTGSIPEALDDLLAFLELHHSTGGHPASAISNTAYSWIASTNVQAVIQEIVTDLGSQAAGSSGASRIGVQELGYAWHDESLVIASTLLATLNNVVGSLAQANGSDKVGSQAQAGTPYALVAGSIWDQLVSLLTNVNAHVAGTTGKHAATKITATPTSTWAGSEALAYTEVQAALDEIVGDLADQVLGAGLDGASRIGIDAMAGTPVALSQGSIRSQVNALLTALDAHLAATSYKHAAGAITYAATATWHGAEARTATDVSAALEEIVTDLAGDIGPIDGSTRIGAVGSAGSPHSLAQGSVRTQLVALKGWLNDHENSIGTAHLAAAISVADAGGYLTAAQVEAALAEIQAQIAGQHYLANDGTYPNQHKKISIPSTAYSQPLEVLRFRGLEVSGHNDIIFWAHFQPDPQDPCLYITRNFTWDGTAWDPIDQNKPASMIRIAFGRVEMGYQAATIVQNQSDAQILRYSFGETTGPNRKVAGERGTCGVAAEQQKSAASTVNAGSVVKWTMIHNTPPASVTLSSSQSSNWNAVPTVSLIDSYGFFISGTSNAGIAQGTLAYHKAQYVTS